MDEYLRSRTSSASGDGTVKLWDMRQLAEPLHVFENFFDGDVLHSHQFRSSKDFAGKRVIVVGGRGGRRECSLSWSGG